MIFNDNKKLLLSLLVTTFLFSGSALAQTIDLDSEFKEVMDSARSRADLSMGAENTEFTQEQVQQAIAEKQAMQADAEKRGLQLPKSMSKTLPVTAMEVTPVNVTPQFVEPDRFIAPQGYDANAPKAAPKSGSMEEILTNAYTKNPAVNSARIALKTVDEQYNQAVSGYLPTVEYNYNTSKDTTTPVVGGAEDDFDLNSNSLNVSQPLFKSGGTYYAVKSAKARVMAAREELRNTEQQFLLDALSSYIDVIFTEKVMKLAMNNETVLEEQLRASKDRFTIGDATRTDVAQSEARLANARSSKVISEGDFINAQANFKRIFGVEPPFDMAMPERLPSIPTTLEEALNKAANNNPQVGQLSNLVKSRNDDINVRTSQLLPQVSLNGAITDSESPAAGGTVLGRESQSIGVNVRVPIYDAGVTWSRTREARDIRDQTKLQYNDVNNQVKSLVVQSWQQILTTAANIDATRSSLLASQYALDGVREEQKEGARTVLDVLDAEQEKFNSETNHARAIKDSVIAIYRLKFSLGELSPEELGLSVPTYNPEEHYKNTRFKFIGL